MISQSELIRYLAEISHFSLSDLFNRANRLRKSEIIRSGGRGRSAEEIETDETVMILLAAMSGVSTDDCPDAARKLFALESTRMIDLSEFPPDTMIRRVVDGVEIEPIALKDHDPTSVDMTQTISLGQLLIEILDDPLKADHVEKFTVDYINGYAIIMRTDRKEVIFGDFDKDRLNSGIKIFLHGRVLRLLAAHLENRKFKASWSTEALKAHMDYTKQVLKIGAEGGEEAAEKWMEKNPFKGKNPFIEPVKE